MPNNSLLIHDVDYLVTMDADRRILRDAWLWIEGGMIRSLGEGGLAFWRVQTPSSD